MEKKEDIGVIFLHGQVMEFCVRMVRDIRPLKEMQSMVLSVVQTLQKRRES
jgi:hypothetical protein